MLKPKYKLVGDRFLH